jgi:hypothetical protein
MDVTHSAADPCWNNYFRERKASRREVSAFIQFPYKLALWR